MSKLTDLVNRLVTPHAPTDKWTGQACGLLDMEIDQQGRWFHQGGEIKRLGLLRLFASVLSKENERYWLTTPIERCEIKVTDAPFMITHWHNVECEGVMVMVAVDNLERQWPICEQYPVTLREYQGQSLPYVELTNGLSARVARNVYYQWADIAEQDTKGIYISSAGMKFYLSD